MMMCVVFRTNFKLRRFDVDELILLVLVLGTLLLVHSNTYSTRTTSRVV